MLQIKETYKYHELDTVKITALETVEVTIGVPPTSIKTNKNGFNHNDLGKGALLHFLSWPPQEKLLLQKGKSISLPPFTAYRVKGRHQITGGDNEVVLSVP